MPWFKREGPMSFILLKEYRKIPVIKALGLYNFIRGFGWAYKQRGLYSGGFISGIEKTFQNEPQQC